MVRFFLGHMVPGTLFLLLSLRWAIATAYEYSLWRVNRHHKRHRKENDYRSTTTMNLPCNIFWLRNRLVESYLKMFGALYGVCFHFFETVDETHKAIQGEVEYNGEFGDTWSIMYRAKHHYIIYGIFVISSAVELMVYYGIKLPEKFDRGMFIVSFAVEAFMFSFHFHGRGNIDVQLHILQTVSIYGTLLFCILEAVNERQVLYVYGRILFVGLQGSWFYQTAFALYYPYPWPDLKWDLHDTRLIANVTFYFCKHFMGVLISMLLLHLLIQWIVTGSWRGEVDEPHLRLRFEDSDRTEYLKVGQWPSDQEDLLEKRSQSPCKCSCGCATQKTPAYTDFVNNKDETTTTHLK